MNATTLLDTFSHFAGSYLATLAIGLVCAYLGLFTVLRRIVFTGVALAQMAAAGVAGAFFVADHPSLPAWLTGAASRHGATVGSLGLAVTGALGFELKRERRAISADALVGMAYAGSSALAVLFVWRSARGLAELQNILAGEVLLSRQQDLWTLAAGLGLVVAVHVAYRRRFLLASFDPEFARAIGLPVRRDQLLLMGSLAVAVALSLKAAGLLLVFAFLVLPPVAGLTLGRRLNESTWVALAVAAGASWLGFLLAIVEDLPVAPTVSLALLALLGLCWLGSLHPRAGQVARLALAALAGTALLATLSVFRAEPRSGGDEGGTGPEVEARHVAPDHHRHDHGEHMEESGEHPPLDLTELVRTLAEAPSAEERRAAAQHLEDLADDRALLPLVRALGDDAPAVRQAVVAALTCLAAHPGTRERLREVSAGEDPELRALSALALLDLGALEGVERLVVELGDGEVPLMLRERLLARLRPLNRGQDLGYDPFAEPAANAEALAAWQAWWRERGSKLHWDAGGRRFVPSR